MFVNVTSMPAPSKEAANLPIQSTDAITGMIFSAADTDANEHSTAVNLKQGQLEHSHKQHRHHRHCQNSNPSTVIRIHETAAPITTDGDMLRGICIPEVTLFTTFIKEDGHPRLHKFLKNNNALVASTLLIVAFLIATLFATMVLFDSSSGSLRKTKSANGNVGPKLSTSSRPKPESFSSGQSFFHCYGLKHDPNQEACVEASCLTDSYNCSCQMYSRWKVSKNIIDYCESCEICGPKAPIPHAGSCLSLGITPSDIRGVQASCDDYPLTNATDKESELFKKFNST